MFDILMVSIISLAISWFLTPLVRRVSLYFNIVAAPNHRTVHNGLTPKLGGLSIFLAFAVGLVLFGYRTGELAFIRPFVFGGAIVVLVGLLDDVFVLGCYRKLLGQILAASVAVYFGISLQTVNLPWIGQIEPGFAGPLLCVFWIVAMSNALNLLDGLDCLASGFSVLTAAFIAIAAVLLGNYQMAATMCLLAAATLGFLRFNLPPAKIFMGDTGSLLLGFVLATVSLEAFASPANGTNVLVPGVLFSVPLADTALAILRRLVKRQHPFLADKKHIHHLLLERGFDNKMALAIILLVTTLAGCVSLFLVTSDMQHSALLFAGFGVSYVLFLKKVGSFEFLNESPFLAGSLNGKSGKDSHTRQEESYQHEDVAPEHALWPGKRQKSNGRALNKMRSRSPAR